MTTPTAERSADGTMSDEKEMCVCGKETLADCLWSCDGIRNDVQALCEQAADVLGNYGITVDMPWDGTMDDLERQRFDGLYKVVMLVRDAERERCARLIEDDGQWTFAGSEEAIAVFEDVRDLAAAAIRNSTHPTHSAAAPLEAR